MENENQRRQNIQSRQVERKNTPWFAYLLVGIGLGLMAGILVKLINPSSITIKFDDTQWKDLKDIKYSICQIRAKYTGEENSYIANGVGPNGMTKFSCSNEDIAY